MIYTLTLTQPGVRYLRALLGRQPHDEVAPLIADLMQQCQRQEQFLTNQVTGTSSESATLEPAQALPNGHAIPQPL